MSEQNEDHRCIICGKLLLDEKIPLCRRCIHEGRDKAIKVGETVLGGGTVIGGAIGIKKFFERNNKG